MYEYSYISHVEYMCILGCKYLATLLVNYSELIVRVKLDCAVMRWRTVEEVCVCQIYVCIDIHRCHVYRVA